MKEPGNYVAAPVIKVDLLSNPAVTLSTTSSISGFVWSDTTKGDRVVGPPNRATGKGDVNLFGHDVYASVFTDEAQKRAIEIEKLSLNERVGATNRIIEELRAAGRGPIAVTVTGETDANGQYTLRTG